MTAVALQRLSLTYDGHRPVVDDVSLDVPAHRITVLLGPSGCGKTTLLKLVAGLLPPSGGDIQFDGASVRTVPAERRGAVMVFQNHLLFPFLSVADNVGFGLRMRGLDAAEIRRRVGEMLTRVQLDGLEQRRPSQLSGGQRQRVALARALVVNPRVLLLDEPLSNLDAHLREEMRGLIRDLQRQLNITTIMVTHDQEEAVIMGDRVALLFDGRLQQVGPPADFYRRPDSRRVSRFFGGVNFIPAEKRGGRYHSCWGPLAALERPLPDGPALLTVRPEQVQICATPGPNRVPARLTGSRYAGTHTRFSFELLEANPPVGLTATSSASDAAALAGQERVYLHLPPEQTWPLPADT